MLSRSSSGDGDIETHSHTSGAFETTVGVSPPVYTLQGPHAVSEHALLGQTPEDRLAELVRGGLSRSEAMNQLARENQEDELRELRESFEIVTALARVVLALEGCRFYVACILWIVVSILYCGWLLVAFCFVILNVIGYLKICLLVRCIHHRNLINWMIILQTALVASAVMGHIFETVRKRRPDVGNFLRDSWVAKACGILCECVGLSLVHFWCFHARELVAHAASPTGCAKSLPMFVYWYSWALQVHKSGLFVVTLAMTPYKMLIAWAARRGLLVTGRGAKTGTLDRMQIVSFKKELFAQPDDPCDSRAQGQCCICFEHFSSDKRIVRTPCQHFLHRSCLKLWLRASSTCPICRCNLEEAEVVQAQTQQEPL